MIHDKGHWIIILLYLQRARTHPWLDNNSTEHIDRAQQYVILKQGSKYPWPIDNIIKERNIQYSPGNNLAVKFCVAVSKAL